MLEFKKVCFKYPKGTFEINDISFKIPCSEITVIKGENGNGKSTVAKLMAGILKPDGGDIVLNSMSIVESSLASIGQKIAYLFQEPANQLFAVNVIEELTFIEELKGNDPQKAEQKARRILADFDMEDISDQNVTTLSRGEKQRLAISALLMNDPEFFIFDEPTSGLDKGSVETLKKVINSLVKAGKGVVIISHNTEFVEALPHKTLMIKGGRMYEQTP